MAGDNVLGFPGKNAQQNAGANEGAKMPGKMPGKMPSKMPGQMPGAGGTEQVQPYQPSANCSTVVPGPTWVLGRVQHYCGVQQDERHVSAWVVEPPRSGYSAILMQR